MVDARWFRVIAIGERHSGPFAGETWQTGISFVQAYNGGNWPGAIRSDLPFAPTDVIGATVDDATWRIDYAFDTPGVLVKAKQLAVANMVVTMFNSLKGQMSTESRLTGVRINAYQADGKVINGASMFDLKAPVVGTASSAQQPPPQLCVVASLRTGARGSSGRGRMYLPLSVAMSSGKVGASTQAAAGNAVKTLCQDLWGQALVPSIVNAKTLTHSSVSNIEVGDLWDVQRRRARQLNETYTAYPPTFA